MSKNEKGVIGMNILTFFSDYLEERRRKNHQRIRERAERLRRQGKNPSKGGWNTMVHSGFGGVKTNPIDRVADFAQQQKNIAEQNEIKERHSGQVKRK